MSSTTAKPPLVFLIRPHQISPKYCIKAVYRQSFQHFQLYFEMYQNSRSAFVLIHHTVLNLETTMSCRAQTFRGDQK